MNTNDALRTAIKQSDMTLDGVSLALGKSKNWLSATFAGASSSKASTVAQIGQITGHVLALVPKKDLPASAIVIDPPENK